MRTLMRVSCAIGFFAVGLSLLTDSAQANNPPLPAPNLNFLLQNPGGTPTKSPFTSFNPQGWTGGSGLIFVDSNSTSNTDPTSACGPTYLQTYGCPSKLAITGGYNEVEADGNPNFESGFNDTITGLTAGQTYTLTFYQAASQQTGFVGNTTEQWIVALGGAGFNVCNGCGAFNATFGSFESTYSDPGASIATTSLMSTPSGGLTDWNFVSLNLTASAPTQLLSFLAWGDDGTTNNLPPMVFLTGVNSAAGLNTPEPGSILLFGTLILGIGGTIWRRRRAVTN
jgi:hypothetical protein